MKKFLTLLMFVVLFSSCSHFFNRKKLLKKIIPVPESNKELDIPKYENGKPFVYWHFTKQKESQLDLNSPETSTDSLIFRVWFIEPSRKRNQSHILFEMKYEKDKWTAQVINMSVDLHMSRIEEKITNYSVTEIQPITKLNNVIDSLYILKIDSLPTDQLLPNYASKTSNYANKAPTVCFEYATPDFYRFYQYNNVWQMENDYWQAKNVTSFIKLIDREFSIDSLAYDFYLKKIKK